jgi:hypothetical protein
MAIVNQNVDLNIVKDGEDNVYYNVRVYNPDNTLIKAEFSEIRVQPILEDPSQYELAVVRFKVPALTIPIFLWPKLESGVEDNDYYKITFSFGGVDYTQGLEFIPNAVGPPLYGPSIWNYQEFINIINVGFEKCFYSDYPTNTVLRFPGAPPTEPPFMTYDAETTLCSIYAEQTYESQTTTPTIDMFFNIPLYTLFPSFPTFDFTEDPKTYQVLIKNTKTNSTTYNGLPYFINEQEYTTLFLWNSFQSIVFESDRIPVESEYLPSQTNVTRRVITDFEPLESVNNRQAFQFYPQGPLRYYDLKSNYPLRNIDIRVFWEDREGNTYPVYVDQGEIFSLKILFRKKRELALLDVMERADDF